MEHVSQSLWSDAPCWKNRNSELIKNTFQAKFTETVEYRDRERRITCLSWSSKELCSTMAQPNSALERALTNKLLIGSENGSIRLLEFDQGAAEKSKETQAAGAKSSLQRDKNQGGQARMLTKLADYGTQGHGEEIAQLKWIRLNPKPN